MCKKIVIVMCILTLCFGANYVHARGITGAIEGAAQGAFGGNGNSAIESIKGEEENSWWKNAYDFLSGYKGEDTQIGNSTVGGIIGFLDPLVNMVKIVGNMVFFAVTVILGVKYIWGGVESKASVKDSLITLIVAALVFYGWNTISALLVQGNNLVFIQDDVGVTAKAIYSTVLYVCNFLAVGGLVYIGARYMMTGAEGKANLKARGVPIVLGIIMVYATLTFLNFIVALI